MLEKFTENIACVADSFVCFGATVRQSREGNGAGERKNLPPHSPPAQKQSKVTGNTICRRIAMETLSISTAHASFVTNIKFCDILNDLVVIWSCFLVFAIYYLGEFLDSVSAT